MPVFGHRSERKDFRFNVGLKVENQTHRALLEAADPHGFHIRVVTADFVAEFFQGGIDINAVNVQSKPVRVFKCQQLKL